MDASLILPLLVALVPIALFFALVRRRPGSAAGPLKGPARAPDVAPSSEPPADFGLARETESGSAPAAAETASGTGAGAAAAAGGALIVGYGASHQADGAPDSGGGDRDGSGSRG